jgi:hypothetical protein
LTSSDSGQSNVDNVTNVLTPSFSIDIEGVSFTSQALAAGDRIELVNTAVSPEVVIGTYVLPDGFSPAVTTAITLAVTADLSPGIYTVVARAVSGANATVTSPDSPSLVFTIDNVAPNAVSPTLMAADDLGASNTDGVTKVTAPSFAVNLSASNAVAGDLLEIYAGTMLLGSVTLTEEMVTAGTAAVRSSALAEGTHNI